LIRQNRLKEKYALLWLGSSLLMIPFSLSRQLLHTVAAFFGIKYAPSLIFLMGFLFLVVINIHLTSVISQLTDRNKSLAQELALLKQALEGMTGKNSNDV
jgi:hypothetical protein